MQRTGELIGTAAAFSAAVIWGLLGFFVRELSALGFTPLQMTCIRYLIVCVLIGAYILVKGRELFRVDRPSLLILLVMGVIGTVVNSVTYFESMSRITLSLASVLQYDAPFFVIFLSVPLLKERLTRTKMMAAVIAFIGCILCTGTLTSETEADIMGIALAAFSGFCFATYIVCSKIASGRGCHVTSIMFYSSLITVVTLLPFCGISEVYPMMAGNLRAVLLVLGMGIVVTLVPFFLLNYSLERIEAGRSSIISYVEPLAATVMGFAVYGETVGWDGALGIALILGALVVLNRGALFRKKGPGEDPGE